MAKNFNTLLDKMEPARRAKVEERVCKTLEKMALHEVRRARKLNQAQVAAGLSGAQSEVSKIENRTDMHVSTLQQYVQALGGRLEMRAVFPDAIVPLELVTPETDRRTRIET
jgi:transcriptional regulator with XRE-family HTH domain